MKSAQPKRFKAWHAALAGAAIFLIGVSVWLGPVLSTAWRRGYFDSAPNREVSRNVDSSLQAVHRALMMYAESEGRLPDAAGWVEAAWPRIKTADLPDEEALKLLQSADAKSDSEYGLAMNKALSGVSPWDHEDQTAVLVFESRDLRRSAHGDPATIGPANRPGKGITLAGRIVDLKK